MTRRDLALYCALGVAVALAADVKRNGVQGMLGWDANLAGLALAKLGMREASIPVFEYARRALPTSTAAALNQAVILGEMGHYEKSLAVYDEIIAAFPDDGDAHYGRSYYQRKLASR